MVFVKSNDIHEGSGELRIFDRYYFI